MITAPTKPGRRFINRACNILVEEEIGAPLSVLPGNPGAVRIITLTDRQTGQQVQLDEAMMSFAMGQIFPEAVLVARRLQKHFDANPQPGRTVRVYEGTAHISGRELTVETDVTIAGVTLKGLSRCKLDEIDNIDLSSVRISTIGGLIAA